MLEIVLPDIKYINSVKKAIAEYHKFPSPFDINSIKKLDMILNNNIGEYFKSIENNRESIGLKKGYVPSTTLWLIKNNEYIGSFDVRHYLTDNLLNIGGHIAYEIIPSQRKKGYVQAGLKLVLKYCKEKLHIDKALLTCRFENEASYKAMTTVMKECGGFIDEPYIDNEIKEHRIWINTSF